jgi:type II restriction/modification system DNA methylase subunit YeeA
LQKEVLGFIVTHMKISNSLRTTLYDFIVETLKKTRMAERGWAALQEPPRCVDSHSLECIYTLCQEAVEKKEDIYRFRTTVATITDAMIDLIQQKEKVTNAQKWRKRQEEDKAERDAKRAEQQRNEEIALAMQHGMEGR